MKNNSKYTAVCDLPAIPLEELKARREHIRQHGVLDQTHVDEQGHIIDGLVRKQIADDLGIDCPEKVHKGLSEEDKRALRRALNLSRRHLTTEQKRELIAAQLQDTPGWANRRIAKALGVTHPTVAAVRKELTGTGKVTSPERTEGLDGNSRPTNREGNMQRATAQATPELPGGEDDETHQNQRGPSEQRSDIPNDASERIQLIHGFCPQALLDIPDQSVDLLLTDPPYPEIDRPYGRYSEAEWLDMMMATIRQGRRLLKPTGSMVIILQPNAEKAGRMRPWPWKFKGWAAQEIGVVQDAYWHNISPIPCGGVSQGLLRPAVKLCVWLGNPDCFRDQSRVLNPDYYRPGRSRGNERKVGPAGQSRRMDRMYETSAERGGSTPMNMIMFSSAHGSPGSEGHPAVTPLPVAEWWCRYLLPPGGVLLDCFVGSGTMLVAGLNHGASKVIGIDANEAYLGICRRRLGLAEAA